MIKQLVTTATLALAATLCLAAEPRPPAPEPIDDPAPAPPAAAPQAPATTDPAADTNAADTTSATGTTTATTVPAADIKSRDDVEVVSKGFATLSVKLDGQQQNLPLGGKLDAALKVVRPGDKLRLFFTDADNNGQPEVVTGFVITDPKRTDADTAKPSERDRNQAPEADADRPAAGTTQGGERKY